MTGLIAFSTRKKSPEGSDCPSLIPMIVPVVRGWDQAISTRSPWVVWGNVTVPPKEGACFLQKNTGDVHHTQRKGSSRHCVLGFSHSPEVLHKACRWSFWNPELPSVQFHLLFSPELEPPHEDNNNWKQPVCDLSVQGHWAENHAFKIQEENYPWKKPSY